MSSVRVTHSIGDLASDLRTIAVEAKPTMARSLQEEARLGNELAKGFARKSAGKHGKHYPNAFSAEMRGIVGFGGSAGISGEYGPDIAKPQGGMSFEGGSRNQPPHLDLTRSADLIGPSFRQEVSRLPDRWFW